MGDNDTIVTILRDKLSEYLNKTINDNLVKTVVGFYKRNNTFDEFIKQTKILGLGDPEKCKNIYDIINDNINKIDKLLNLSENLCETTIGNKKKEGSIRKPTLALSFENEENADVITDPIEKSSISFKKINKKKPFNKVKLDFDDDIDVEESKHVKEPEGKQKFNFKKIKKEDAIKKKEFATVTMGQNENNKQNSLVNKGEDSRINEKAPLSISELAELERKSNSVKEDDSSAILADIDEEIDIENDREWYLAEEDEYAAGDSMDVNTSTVSHKRIPKRRQQNSTLTGGVFDEETGQYIDFDHDTSNTYDDISRIPINSHFLIPPFLELAENDLKLHINGPGLTKIGPTISPVKDSRSELAILAKQGSFVVKDKKAKNERAEQTKQNSSLANTALGSILGVDNGPHEQETDKTEEETADEVEQLSIQQQRRSLPAFAVRDNLIQTIMENQITIVIGETGSGKTTQLGQFLYEEGLGKNLESDGIRKIIGCTQPRRVAAMSVAKRVSEEMNCKLGGLVGYSIRFEDRSNPSKTVIKFMSEGILLREILADPNLENYSCIIMDEAHERSLNTDVLLGLFKNLVTRRKDLKLIITSATMNADRFARFFGNAPQFTIPGRTFPVDVLFSKAGCSDYVETAVKQVLTIHLQSTTRNDGDILVFMTGQEDIEITCELIKEKLALLDEPPPLDIYPIYSTMPADLQKKIFNKSNSQRRKVVVATNIAETSLTVDGIKYVIDTGLVKQTVYNPKLGMNTLQVIPISLANAQQRSGRAGRTGPGIAYRLYTEKATSPDQMYSQPIPEIQRTNLSNVMLMLKSLGVNDIGKFPFLDSPPRDLLHCSLYELWSIGALDNLGDLTSLGKSMSKFPMVPTLAKLILLSCGPEFQCSEDMITIVSMLSVPSVFFRPKERANEADLAREKFVITESDHLTLLNVYNQWEMNLKKFNKNYKKLNQWAAKNFLHAKSLLRAKDIRNQILLIMNQSKLPVLKSKTDDDIRKCLCASFYQQLAKLIKVNVNGSSEFMNLRHNYMKMYLHPTSALNDSNLTSTYVIYHELILTTKEYMSCVTSVDPLWLLEYGYLFYEVDERYSLTLNDISLNLIGKKDIERLLEQDKERYKRREQEELSKRSRPQTKYSTGLNDKFKKRRAF